MGRSAEQPAVDLRVQVVSAMVESVVRVARVSGLGLDELHDIVTRAYFVELKDRGLSWQQIGRRLGRSRTVVAGIARRAARTPHALSDSEPLALRRALVALLVRREAVSLGAACTALHQARDRILEQLDTLVEQGIVRMQDDHYVLCAGVLDLTGEEAAKRVGALRHFLTATAEIIFQRFLSGRLSQEQGFARVLTFRCADTGQTSRTLSGTYRRIETLATAEDARATARGVTTGGSLVFAFAPSPEGFPWGMSPDD